ncbi:hemin receptor [Acuticoccus sediminis]|uniref:Hemin receptor n=1 Tax=Acuticoccus sediminis TaxID=2184697 RepID=A0A8B2NTT9_9HYPH|nr:globin family protein [Acuticoccus sediminis]RAI03618.1 hemin receptor [Acuticoccus sediminis]
MTPEKVALVQESFKKVAPIAETAADIFYGRLFEQNPELTSLFPAEMAEQKKKLMKTLGVAVSNLHQVDTIVPVVEALGVKHVAYGVRDEHYDAVGAALLYTLEKGLGDAWTAELKDAWTETYVLVSTVMKNAAHKAEAEAVVVAVPKRGFFSRLFG